MMVTYRLAGVDGEATEEVVDSLVDSDSAADQDPEVKFGIARDIAEVRWVWCTAVLWSPTTMNKESKAYALFAVF